MDRRQLSERLGYSFKDESLLELALSHSSYSNERGLSKFGSNERLEFLGDALLEGFVSVSLYHRLPHCEEGALTKLRARVVCEKSLFLHASRLSLGECLKLGRGEELGGGRERPSILADALEAVIGAIFLDGGMEAAEGFVKWLFADAVEEAAAGSAHDDWKSRLQELLQVSGPADIRYQVDREEGPDHEKTFYVSVFRDDGLIGRGEGRSKKLAEQDAAQKALERIG